MSLNKILSIGGKPGLYRLITQTRTGLVAQALSDGKKISVGNLKYDGAVVKESIKYFFLTHPSIGEGEMKKNFLLPASKCGKNVLFTFPQKTVL